MSAHYNIVVSTAPALDRLGTTGRMYVQLLQPLIAILLAVVCGETIFEMMHYDLLDGKTCTQHIFETVARSDISCVTRCGMESTCQSSFYTPDTKRCTGCDSVYSDMDLSPLTNEPGPLYYRPHTNSCSSQKIQVCSPDQDACQCDPAFVYDPSSASCTTGCTTYGLTYKKSAGYYLKSYDGLIQSNQLDVINCLSYCAYNTTFLCYSVDYSIGTNTCYFNKERITGSLINLLHRDGYDNYIRNCAC